MRLELNKAATIKWEDLGDGTEALVVDDAFKNPDRIREYALGLRFSLPSPQDHYPGLKAVTSLAGAQGVAAQIVEWFLERRWGANRPENIRPSAAKPSPQMFAAMTIDRQRAQDVVAEQHVDNFAWIASVLYLFASAKEPNFERGTAFWAHKATGLQHWFRGDPCEIEIMEKFFGLRMRDKLAAILVEQPAVKQEVVERAIFDRRRGDRPCFSTAAPDPNWRLIKVVGARFNRLVAYPTFQVHSEVDMTNIERLTAANVRLTLNSFVSYPIDSPGSILAAYDLALYRGVEGLFTT